MELGAGRAQLNRLCESLAILIEARDRRLNLDLVIVVASSKTTFCKSNEALRLIDRHRFRSRILNRLLIVIVIILPLN